MLLFVDNGKNAGYNVGNKVLIKRWMFLLRCSYYDVSELSQQEIFVSAMKELVWKQRAEKAERYRFDKDKRLCMGAGLLAQDMLKKAGAADLRLGYSQFGKPYLLTHSDIHFNLSHDGQIAVCAVSDEAVGVDVQQLTVYDPKVAGRVFTDDEIGLIEGADDRDAAFTQMWARKESLIKLYGTGFLKDAKEFSVPQGEGRSYFFSELPLEKYYICVCSEKYQEAEFSGWAWSERE